MHEQIIKKFPGFVAMEIFAITILLLNGSCSKDAKPSNTPPGGSLIVYTDVNPDTTISVIWPSSLSGGMTKYYNLDMDKDGTEDFKIYVFAGISRSGFNMTGVEIATSRSGNALATTGGGINILDSLAVIDSSSATWWPSAANLNPPGVIWNHDTAYLGLKLSTVADIHYGWVRLSDVSTGLRQASATILDYGYNKIPNQPILAGQTK